MTTKRHIFISYARRDGRDLALRLQADLMSDGYEIWLDTSGLTGRGWRSCPGAGCTSARAGRSAWTR
jgi:hypothetical protein